MLKELKERVLGVFEDLVIAVYREQTGKIDALLNKMKNYAYLTKPADLEKEDPKPKKKTVKKK